MTANIDQRIFDLIPHRPPMLLINHLQHVEDNASSSKVVISTESAFFEADKGVPSVIGLEYMGQTAALIAGYQLEKGTLAPHLGFLLGSRKFEASVDYFVEAQELMVTCNEGAVAGNLATFNCEIIDAETNNVLAKAVLSVFRQELGSA